MAIKRLRNHKAAGLDDFVAEMIKVTTEKGVDIIHKVFSKIWTTGEFPKKWCVSIHKKGDKGNYNNYRT
ncbi:Reverse transcriptase domain-containing protein [Aphis craccivora]|uniref:Reverse transcriptase domain-containing protein n=1 Tax=Aphis craccivora TaxID=307492 RepID=A0A6G0W0P4_APHCR|nr:Reverse transcriptase domain-containing protein [Aphis craccivora]